MKMGAKLRAKLRILTWDRADYLFIKRFEVNKKGIISSEKTRNLGNYVYDYAHSFFGEDL